MRIQGVSKASTGQTSWSALSITRSFWPVHCSNVSKTSRCAFSAPNGVKDSGATSTRSKPPSVRSGQKWTKAEDEHMSRLRKTDRRDADIAHELGRSLFAIKARFKRLLQQPDSGFERRAGLSPAKVSAEKVRKLPEEATSVPSQFVPVFSSQNLRKWTQASAVRLQKAGFTRSDIAANPGRSVTAINDHIRRLRRRSRPESDDQGEEALPVAFSAEEDRQILALQAAGVSWDVIASQLGRSVRIVSERYHHHLSPSLYIDPLVQSKKIMWTQHEDDELLRSRVGASIQDLAAKFGRSVMDCKKRLYYLRLQAGKRLFGPKKWSPDDDNMIVRLLDEGLTSAEILPRLPNRSFESVRARMLARSSSQS